MKQIIYKNILANILVLTSGFIGMKVLLVADSMFSIPTLDVPRIIGLIFILLGLITRVFATISFTKNSVDILSMNHHPHLVTDEIFKYSRNPFYLGIIFISLGFVLLANSIFGIFLTVIFFIFWNFIIKRKEEKELQSIFGERYLKYKSKTRRWL